uniref:3-deoxy-manno-octulosonate cytidylyltransferase (CMP-KDO synthetase) n=1 Tax=Candidatus Kentrum sp. DK TaxID=2126562 RepID=A0A450T2L9_9GAMM|nr:MAG: 3-deoxy-manno-octulosonate cytidylyltransferase (CMP-KDO synthetase) [Candidatus Kentron sp. DK]
MRYVVIIPARYQSTRLPGKPLVELCGKPMIVRTYSQCAKVVSPDRIFVATDDQRIVDVCSAAGIQTILTSGNCLTGTDRVAEAAQQLDADVFINVQGDEPIFEPRDLQSLVDTSYAHPNEILNGYCPINDEVLFRSGTIPKVVLKPDGRLLYMSRAPIPTDKSGRFICAWRQVCAYAFPKIALHAFAAKGEKTLLESMEDIEILRFLELGWDIQMIPMTDASIAVDTPEDVTTVEIAIIRRGL